ncbi:MAG: metal ABC transporter permease [Dehalococcoidia bacterium]|nr:metal ABC transporter permease [Dehalococcoidia bacterium]
MNDAGSFPVFSWNLWLDIQQMLQYEFMRNALLSGTALSIVSGLVGYFVIVRHQAFAGESLSDVAFTGAVGGAAIGINPLAGMLVFTVAAAVAMGAFAERLSERDIAIGTVLAWVLGLGLLFLTLFSSHVSGTGTGFSGVTVLFGSILSVSASQTLTIVLLSAGIMLVVSTIARPLLFASLDPDVAAARGVPVRLLGLGFMALLAITVGEAVQAVGALLVFALLLLPAATAQRLTTRPYAGLWLAALLAVCFTWTGITIGFYTGLPSSVCISLLAFCVYIVTVGLLTMRPLFNSRPNAATI